MPGSKQLHLVFGNTIHPENLKPICSHTVNIRDLELFKHLAATLHFGKTALECNITPSGLTRTIQRLENEIGETLFFRTNRSVNLTPAGLLFREYCEETLTRFYLFKSGLKSDTALHGELSVYCSVTAILSILPQIFKQFRSTYPKVNVRLQTGDAAKALVKLQNREVDIAIAALPDQRPKAIEFIKLIETPLLFIAPKFFPDTVVWREQQIDWEKSPLILPLTGLSRTRVEDWFGKNNIRPFIYSQVAGNEAIIAMVSMGSGIGIVPQLVLEKSSLRNKVDVLDTGPRLKPFVVGACTLAANLNNRVVQSFWDVTGEAVSTSNNSV